MGTRTRLAGGFASLCIATFVWAAVPPVTPSLRIGDRAPPLQVATWIKGTPVAGFEPGHAYVIEFWATWCGPCNAMMPRLSALQKKFEGRLIVIGVDAREAEYASGEVESVRKFVTRKGDKMSYRVATDDPVKHPVFDTWMAAAGAQGIPTTFLVDGSGRVVWIGHPLFDDSFDTAVEQTLNGTLDLKASRAKQDELANADGAALRAKALLGPLNAAMKKKDYAAAVTEADRLIARDSTFEPRVFGRKYTALLHLDVHRAAQYARSKQVDPEFMARAGYAKNPDIYLANLGEAVAEQDGLARDTYRSALNRLNELVAKYPDQVSVWSSIAQLDYRLGDVAHAVSAQQTAIRLAEKQGDEAELDRLREALAAYQNERT